MSQYPQDYSQSSSLPYASGPVVSTMPTCVRVIGIIGIVLGAITLLNHVLGILMFVAMKNDIYGPGYTQFNILNSLVFGGCAAFLLAASIGLLFLQEWARKLMLIYAVGYPFLMILGTLVMTLYVIPVLVEPHASKLVNGSITVTGMYIGAIVAAFLLMILPIFILVLFSKPPVKTAFR